MAAAAAAEENQKGKSVEILPTVTTAAKKVAKLKGCIQCTHINNDNTCNSSGIT